MAQRRRAVGTFASGLFCRMTLLLPSLAGQPEEGQAVPAGAGDGHGNRTERRVMPVLKPEPIRQNLDQKGPPLALPAEQRARQGQAVIRGQWKGRTLLVEVLADGFRF